MKKFQAWIVVDVDGKGYSIRHGEKETPSVYEYERNAQSFIQRVLTKKGKELFLFACEITCNA